MKCDVYVTSKNTGYRFGPSKQMTKQNNNNNNKNNLFTIYSAGVNIFIIEYWVGGPEKNHRSYLAGTTFLLLTHTFNSN